jgi:hypothetical protein
LGTSSGLPPTNYTPRWISKPNRDKVRDEDHLEQVLRFKLVQRKKDQSTSSQPTYERTYLVRVSSKKIQLGHSVRGDARAVDIAIRQARQDRKTSRGSSSDGYSFSVNLAHLCKLDDGLDRIAGI